MKALIKIPLLLLLLVVLTACPHSDVENIWFMVTNNSTKTIYVLDGYVQARIDTTFPIIDSTGLTGPIEPNKSNGITRNRPIEMDSMTLFIIDADTLKKYGWLRVRSEYKILQRYDLNITNVELKRLKYNISYPPTEDMKNIHMYPPYGVNK